MGYFLRVAVSFIFVGNLIGCSAINLLFNDEEVFVNERNSDVGKPISKVLKSGKYYFYWEGQPAYLKQEYKVIPIDGGQSEYQFAQGTCEWALTVNDENKVVTKWRYLQKTEDCRYKKFYEGAF